MNRVIDFIKKNYVVCISIAIFIALLIMMAVLWIRRGTFGLEDEELPPLVLSCPEAIGYDEDTTCFIYVISEGENKIMSLKANYIFPEEIEYVSYDNENEDILVLAATSNGFAVANTNGFEEITMVGALKFKLHTESEPNTNYTIGLTDIELSLDNDEMQELEDISFNLRVKNNIATVESVTVSNEDVEVTYDEENKTYSATVPSNVSEITIGAVPTDQNASMEGITLGETVELHYGTNEFEFIVVAENGDEEEVYTLSIYREYEFNTEVYTYNKDNNYIYTGADSNETIKNSLEILETGLSYNINNGKLEVRYDEEVVSSINIVNYTTDYSVKNGNLYIGDDVSVTEFFSKINTTINNLNFKLYNGSGTLISATKEENTYVPTSHGTDIITSKYTIEIEYILEGQTSRLETLKFVTDQYNLGNLIVDEQHEIIKRLPIGSTFATLRSQITTNGNIAFIAADGSLIEDENTEVKTGDMLQIEFEEETVEYFLSVVGVLDEFTKVDFTDVIILYRAYRGRIQLSNELLSAGDINNDGSIDFGDVILLYRYYRGRINTLEVTNSSEVVE